MASPMLRLFPTRVVGVWWVTVVAILLLAPQVQSREDGPEYPLIAAIRNSDLDTAGAVLRAGADVNERQGDGATALHWAAYRDDFNAVEWLLEAGADVSAANELGATPLWVAAVDGSASIIERLLRSGANPNVTLPEGETPLMTTARSGSVQSVSLLLSKGADPNARETRRNQTALMWAAAQGDATVVGALLEAGADVHARSRVRQRLLFADRRNARQYEQGVEVAKGGYTPILFAARQGHVAVVKELISHGADVNDTAPDGTSALIIAAHSGHVALVEYLLEAGANPNARDAGYAPLHAAVLRGEFHMVRALLAYGADPNVRLEKGTPLRRASLDWAIRPQFVTATPFWLAARYKEPAIMQVLADAGADPLLGTLPRQVPVKPRAGGIGPPHTEGGFESPLLAAVRGEHDRERRFLLNGLFVDRDLEERLALETVELAIDLGADIEAVDGNGNTVLHSAASINFVPLVRLLAERGANLEAMNKSGRTPLDAAKAAEERRARRSDTVESGSSTVDILQELGASD